MSRLVSFLVCLALAVAVSVIVFNAVHPRMPIVVDEEKVTVIELQGRPNDIFWPDPSVSLTPAGSVANQPLKSREGNTVDLRLPGMSLQRKDTEIDLQHDGSTLVVRNRFTGEERSISILPYGVAVNDSNPKASPVWWLGDETILFSAWKGGTFEYPSVILNILTGDLRAFEWGSSPVYIHPDKGAMVLYFSEPFQRLSDLLPGRQTFKYINALFLDGSGRDTLLCKVHYKIGEYSNDYYSAGWSQDGQRFYLQTMNLRARNEESTNRRWWQLEMRN